MSTVITNSMLSAVDARLRNMFFEAKGNIPLIGEKLVRVRKTDRPYEVFNRFIGVGETSTVDENGPYSTKDIKQWTSKTVNVVKFGCQINVSREMVMDDMFTPIADNVARALRNSQEQAKERRILNIINNGFATTTTADGSYLFYSHTLAQGGSQANYESTPSTLDVDSLWSAINRIKTSVSNSGLYDSIHMPKYLVVPQALERMAIELQRSEFVPFKLQNEVNALQEYPMQILTSPLLSSSTAWFTFADPSDMLAESLILLEREPISIKALFDIKGDTELGSNIDLDVYSWRTRARYEAAAIGWLGTHGNAGA